MSTDNLAKLFELQSALQKKMPTPNPEDLLPNNPEGAIEFITWNTLALTDELHELLGETGWKPWATSHHINLTAARSEWIDALHFLLNLGLVLGLDSDSAVQLYQAKHAKNTKRQADGYDGVTTKCPGCRRALDDDGVDCEVVNEYRLGGPVYPKVVVCAKHGRVYPISQPHEEAPSVDL